MTDPSGTLRYVPEDQVNTAMQSGGKVYQPAPSFWQDPKTFLQTRAGQMGQEAQNQMNQALGPESQGKSLLSRMGHATLSYLPATAQVIDKAASGLVGTDADTWKNAAMVAAGAIDPALPGAYFATQGTGQLTGLTPGVTPGDLSPGNVQNALLAGASVAGGASAAGTPNAGATLKAGPPIARTAIKTANTVLNKAPELVLGGAGAAVGGAIGGGYGAGIGEPLEPFWERRCPRWGVSPERILVCQPQRRQILQSPNRSLLARFRLRKLSQRHNPEKLWARSQECKRNPRHKLRTCNQQTCNPCRKLPQRGQRPCFNSTPLRTHLSLPGMLTIRRRKPRRCSLRMGKFINTSVLLRKIGRITKANQAQARDSRLTLSAILQPERAALRDR